MSKIPAALRAAYPGIDFESEVVLFDDGTGTIVIKAWNRVEPEPDLTQLLAEYDELADAKSARLIAIRAEARQHIETKWPDWLQRNIALGLDPDLAQPCADDIAAVRTASNASENAINAATTVAEVEAVSASWPVL